MSLIIMDKICELEAVDRFGLMCFTFEVRPEKVEQSSTWWYYTFLVMAEKFKIFSYLVFPRFVNAFMDCPFC